MDIINTMYSIWPVLPGPIENIECFTDLYIIESQNFPLNTKLGYHCSKYKRYKDAYLQRFILELNISLNFDKLRPKFEIPYNILGDNFWVDIGYQALNQESQIIFNKTHNYLSSNNKSVFKYQYLYDIDISKISNLGYENFKSWINPNNNQHFEEQENNNQIFGKRENNNQNFGKRENKYYEDYTKYVFNILENLSNDEQVSFLVAICNFEMKNRICSSHFAELLLFPENINYGQTLLRVHSAVSVFNREQHEFAKIVIDKISKFPIFNSNISPIFLSKLETFSSYRDTTYKELLLNSKAYKEDVEEIKDGNLEMNYYEQENYLLEIMDKNLPNTIISIIFGYVCDIHQIFFDRLSKESLVCIVEDKNSTPQWKI